MSPGVRQRIVIQQSATGESTVRVLMDVGNGLSSHVGNDHYEVECVALDSMLHDVPVSFIKMDIEGSKIATLTGAQKLIRKNKPLLAISVYHKQDGLWNISLFINNIYSDYSFHLRPHMLHGWDLVLYAIPNSRSH
jgi:hypothetical protein